MVSVVLVVLLTQVGGIAMFALDSGLWRFHVQRDVIIVISFEGYAGWLG